MQKGRAVPIYRPGINRAGEVAIPACDLTLPDGIRLIYRGRSAPQSVGGGATLTLSAWYSTDGLAVAASIDRLPHLHIKSKLGFLHLSISRNDRYPSWDEMVQVAETIAGPDLDMAMIKPRRLLPGRGHHSTAARCARPGRSVRDARMPAPSRGAIPARLERSTARP